MSLCRCVVLTCEGGAWQGCGLGLVRGFFLVSRSIWARLSVSLDNLRAAQPWLFQPRSCWLLGPWWRPWNAVSSTDGGSQKRLHHEWSLLSALIMTDSLGFACWERDCCLTFMWGRVVSLGWRPVEQVWWRLRQGLCRP